MNHIAVTFIRKENRDLYTARQVSVQAMYPGLLTDIRKPAVAVYMAESLYRAGSERHHGDGLYHFALAQMEKLETSDRLSHFPQQFLAGLIDELGLTPQGRYSLQTPDFLLDEGAFRPAYSGEPGFSVRGGEAEYLSELFRDTEPAAHPRDIRRETRRRLEEYLRLHLDGRFHLLSGEVLETVFDD